MGSIILYIMVSDTGIGIAVDKIKYIFDRFRKVSDSTNNLYGGVGLGLSIALKLSQLLKCELWATSKLNKGSEFTLLIPEKYVIVIAE